MEKFDFVHSGPAIEKRLLLPCMIYNESIIIFYCRILTEFIPYSKYDDEAFTSYNPPETSVKEEVVLADQEVDHTYYR